MSEMGRALQLEGRDPGATVRDWETRNRVSGPVAVSLAFMLGGDPITSRLSEIVDPRTSVAKND
ncbi:hypothetical protein [Xanthobacter agilis]|uniref:XRE family transcriptional regulator n=1 Tax=Xanthobacter agilis TaxID=47492 RepID=A0ABU0LJX6_XANAG|nr:hypothetical protein [Xanthobacter agilis]MDQ0507442.1 hypothetical protein [Xanthobacter agilis]